jgi:hypothetical protein
MELKKIMLSIGIAFLTALFVAFLIDAFYPSPSYDEYCNRYYESYPAFVKDETLCNFTFDQELRNNCSKEGGWIISRYDERGCVNEEICNFCDRDYQNQREAYNQIVLFITAPIGLFLILLGIYLPRRIDAIAGGFLLAGIITMIQITIRVFGDLGKWSRVLILGVELGIILWIGMKKVYHFSSKKKGKTKKQR